MLAALSASRRASRPAQRALAALGASVEAQDVSQRTPLHIAASQNDADAVEALADESGQQTDSNAHHKQNVLCQVIRNDAAPTLVLKESDHIPPGIKVAVAI